VISTLQNYETTMVTIISTNLSANILHRKKNTTNLQQTGKKNVIYAYSDSIQTKCDHKYMQEMWLHLITFVLNK
jgi:hypothetical protein